MKKYIILALVLLSTTATAQKKRLAVLDFTPHNLPETAAKSLRSRFELALFRYGAFDLLERDKIDLIAREHNVSVRCSTADCAVRVGKLISADYIATGTVDKDRDTVLVLRIVDVATGTIAYADSVTCASGSPSFPSLETLASRVSTRFSPENLNPHAVRPYASFGGGLLVPRGDISSIAGNTGVPFLALGVDNFLYRGSLYELTLLYANLPGAAHLTGSAVVPVQFTVGHSVRLPWNFYIAPLLSGGASWNSTSTDEETTAAVEPVVTLGAAIGYRGNAPWFVSVRSHRLWLLEEGGPVNFDAHLLVVGLYL
jgi:hypothetical protein